MTEESDVIYFDAFEIPDGFRLITLGAPPTFISAKEVETRALYMLLCIDDLSWMFGRITKYKPRATKFNFDVIWSGDDEEHQGANFRITTGLAKPHYRAAGFTLRKRAASAARGNKGKKGAKRKVKSHRHPAPEQALRNTRQIKLGQIH